MHIVHVMALLSTLQIAVDLVKEHVIMVLCIDLWKTL